MDEVLKNLYLSLWHICLGVGFWLLSPWLVFYFSLVFPKILLLPLVTIVLSKLELVISFSLLGNVSVKTWRSPSQKEEKAGSFSFIKFWIGVSYSSKPANRKIHKKRIRCLFFLESGPKPEKNTTCVPWGFNDLKTKLLLSVKLKLS